MFAGISRAMIFSNKVLLTGNFLHGFHGLHGLKLLKDGWGEGPRQFPSVLIREIRVKALFHHERAVFLRRFGGETFAQVFDNLVLDFFAAPAPALRAGELLHATAQSAKA